MFSPIKNLITYIQKNASGNSIFGGNSTPEESTKMETQKLKTENSNMESEDYKNPDKKEENETNTEEGENGTSKKEVKETSKEEEKKTFEKEEMETSEEDEKETSKEDEKKTSQEDEKETDAKTNIATCKEDEKYTYQDDETYFPDDEIYPKDKNESDHEDEKETCLKDQIKTNPDDENQNSLEDEKNSSTENEKQTNKDGEKEQLPEDSSSELGNHKIKITTSTISAENSCEFEEDDEDIEAQIGSSIMLKKPIKVTSKNGTEILEVKKSSSASSSIVISHDISRNQTLTPIDDELQDFCIDPTEALRMSTSSPSSNHHADEFCSVGSVLEAKERDESMAEDFPTEEEGDEMEEGQKTEEDEEIEMDDKDGDDDDEEEPFLDLENYKKKFSSRDNDDVIVLSDMDLNTSTASIETVNTADDPLAIACEEQEAFAADKSAALEELNLLNTSQASQDEDTTTTIDDDLQWLKTDLEDPQPSCSSKVPLKVNPTTKGAPEKEERNGEGSDSGLGSETSALHNTTTSITDTSQLNTTNTATPTQSSPTQLKSNDVEKLAVTNVMQLTKTPSPKPIRSNLKRRLDVDDDDVDGLGNLTPSTSTSSLLSSDHSTLNGSLQKKPKRSINFDNVQVYYFPRQQGFGCVPSAGGCTLGMGARHVGFKTLTLAEHAAELRRAHRMQLQEINPRGSSSDDSEESEEDYLSEGSGSDLDGETNGFLQPVSPKQRRALLKAAGVRKIDAIEKADCRNIRNSREVCGCSCRDFCDPETCACSQSGIKCQVDRDMFPCGCSRDACGNTIGRVEFNPARVRTHFIHTLMRLEMENRQQQIPYSSTVASNSDPLQTVAQQQQTPSSYYQPHLQPQSNYSSGYASPAYNTASELHQQQTTASSFYHSQTPSTANGLYVQQTTLDITLNGSSTTTASSQYGIDSLDASLFGGSSTATPSYGELLPVASYHYANAQSQGAPYNSYHNTTIYHNSTTTLNTPPNTYSSCAVPSIPPYGTATTTEATGVCHSLTSPETTTAPSCNFAGNLTSSDSDPEANFISLSTPLASSSRLSQINDLLQHNRNATTALVAVTQSLGVTSPLSSASSSSSSCSSNGTNYNATSSSINTPPIEDAHKTCMAYEELAPPLKPAPIVGVVVENGPNKLTKPLPPLPPLTAASPAAIEGAAAVESSSASFLTSPLCKDDKEKILTPSVETTPTTEVAAGN